MNGYNGQVSVASLTLFFHLIRHFSTACHCPLRLDWERQRGPPTLAIGRSTLC